MLQVVNYIDGALVPAHAGAWLDNVEPATGSVYSQLPDSDEHDVRQAVRQGRKIVIGDRTIVTPAARDLGEQHHVLVQAGLKA